MYFTTLNIKYIDMVKNDKKTTMNNITPIFFDKYEYTGKATINSKTRVRINNKEILGNFLSCTLNTFTKKPSLLLFVITTTPLKLNTANAIYSLVDTLAVFKY